MEDNEFKKYLNERYYPQIEWYDKKAIWNQKLYKIFQWGIIILASVTPILVIIGDTWIVGHWSAVLTSCLVAIGAASLKTFKFQENWINYRTTCETLRKEIHYYNARVDDYGDSNDPMGLFIKRVEALISRENTLWLAVQKQKKENSETTSHTPLL